MVTKTEDYNVRLNGLPKSDVLKYFYEGTFKSGHLRGGILPLYLIHFKQKAKIVQVYAKIMH